jgi:hypothetical protein
MAKHRGPGNTAEQHWARLTISRRFWRGARTLAERCGWRVREESGALLVCTNENYTKTAPRLLTLERIADAKTVEDLTAFDWLRGWAPQDGLLSDDTRRRATEDLRRCLKAGQLPDILYALRLNVINARDAHLPNVVQDALRFTVTRSSEASAWGIRIEPHLHWRFTALRALLAATDTPELLDRGPEDFRGFQAAEELMVDARMGLDCYLTPALLALSPGTYGIAAGRTGGIVILLFGDAILGLREAPAAEVLQVYRAEPMTSDAPLLPGGPRLSHCLCW